MVKDTHICIITASNIFGNLIGGEGKYAILLQDWLKNQGIKSTLLGNTFMKIKIFDRLPDQNKVKPTEKQTKKKNSLNFYPFFMIYRLGISILLAIKILKLHWKSPFSLIHSQDTGYTGLVAILIGRILSIPVVVSSHGIRHKTIEHSLSGIMKKTVIKIEYNLDIFTIKHADEVITDSITIKNYFERIMDKKIRSIPIPIQLDKFRYSMSDRVSVRNELGCEETGKVIGFVGRFAPEKNLISLVVTFSRILKKHSKSKLVLVGTGPLEPQLRKYVDDMKITENVNFYGARYDINRILSGFDIFVLPSFTEGMSVALLEAMATGCAIVCSRITTNTEIIIHKKEGMLVDPYDINDIEKVIIDLIEDDALRENLKQNATKKAREFDIDKVFNSMYHVYEKLLKNSSK